MDLDAPARFQIERFYRQVLQLEPAPKHPDTALLPRSDVQETIYQRLFVDGAVPFPPPPRYRLKVLKDLIFRIEASIDDWEEHGVSENLVSAMSPMLCIALPGEFEAAQQQNYVTYSLSELAAKADPCPTITLLESRSLLSAGGTTGLRTWEAALHLGQYLCLHKDLVRGKNVIELGAGTGYVSILCARYLEAASVIASDGSDNVVSHLADAFFLNGLQESAAIRAMDLAWGSALVGTEDSQWNSGRPLDLILGADITFDVRIIPSLIGTLAELSDLYPGIEIIISYIERNVDAVQVFIHLCLAAGYHVRELEFASSATADQQGPFYDTTVPIRIISCARIDEHLDSR